MSTVVRGLLENYHELEEHPRLLNMKIDLDNALGQVNLTEEEWEIIQMRYLIEPLAPIRDRLNRLGDKRGRPPGGNTQFQLARLMNGQQTDNAKHIHVSRLITSACGKLALFLGEDYKEAEVPTS